MRNILLAALGSLALAAVALVGVRWFAGESETAVALAEVPIGGPFTLTDQNGRRVSDEEFRGRLMLVYFGYTFCPDMCPLGLSTMADALDDLPPELQDQVVPVFITVDPERDTPAVLLEYVPQFSPRLVGLTGTPAEITAAERAYRVYASKSDATAADGSYLVDHSTFTYLMGRDGKYLSHFGHDTTPEDMAKAIDKFAAQS